MKSSLSNNGHGVRILEWTVTTDANRYTRNNMPQRNTATQENRKWAFVALKFHRHAPRVTFGTKLCAGVRWGHRGTLIDPILAQYPVWVPPWTEAALIQTPESDWSLVQVRIGFQLRLLLLRLLLISGDISSPYRRPELDPTESPLSLKSLSPQNLGS